MKLNFTFSTLILLGLSTYGYAETASALPTTTQMTENTMAPIDKIEIVSEITIDTSTAQTNSNLKDGVACDDENLEPAEVGPAFEELPMAQTEPCTTVNCRNLDRAVMHQDNYKKLPMAETIEGCDK